MHIQWFPGHMTKSLRMMRENASLCDVLLYVVDTRAVLSCINPAFEELTQGKKVIYIFNKCDLVENRDVKMWETRFVENGKNVIKTVGTSANSATLVKFIKDAMSEVLQKYKDKGVKKSIRAMVIGVPNSGKSTLVNSMRKKTAAKTGNKPGVTRGKQWINLDENIDLLDTPGTLWAKFSDQTTAKHLAYIGSISDDVLDFVELATSFLTEMKDEYKTAIENRYGIDFNGDSRECLTSICVKRGYLQKGGEPDLERAGRSVIDDFRKGKIGKIMLEKQ